MSTSDSLVNKELARALKGLKAESGLTLDQLESRSGMSKSTVRRILKGETDITMVNVAALTGAMGETPDRALTRTFEKLDYNDAYLDAVERIRGRSMSDVPENITSLDQKRAAAALDRANVEGTERIAADVNEEADYDEPEAP